MVSTRGGARTGTEVEIALRKKPVRKTSAKPTAKSTTKATKITETVKPAAKTRATRSKRVEPEPEEESVQDEVDELDQEEVLKVPKLVKKTTVRARKEKEPTKAAPAKKTQTASTRTATSRTTQSISVRDDAPALPPPAKSAATRATRATASKSKAPPLSPKKVTQVTQAPPRSTRNAKAVPSKPAKTATATNPTTTRRRNVSDENAGIELVEPETEKAKPTSTAESKSRTTIKGTFESHENITEDETPMSSRPTTPADSPSQHLDDMEDNDAPEMDEETDSEAEEGVEVSVDELFGPKTPMKRVSPREGNKFISAQKSSRLDGAAMQTPVRRFAVLGTQRGTPQTQKPYCKPTVPPSEVRPTTVARARDRATVFPQLQPLAVVDSSEDETHSEYEQAELTVPSVAEMETNLAEDDVVDQPSKIFAEQDLASVIPDGDAIPDLSDSQIESCEEQQDLTITLDDSEAVQDESLQEVADEPVIHFSMEQSREIVSEPVIQFSMEEPTSDMIAEPVDDDLESEVLSGMDVHNPNETLVEGERMEDVYEEHDDVSELSDESVIITRQIGGNDDAMLDDSMEDLHLPTVTPRPETIVWQNIRDDVTIPFNFDGEVSPCRALPQVEATELLSIPNSVGNVPTFKPSGVEAVIGDRETIAATPVDQGVSDIARQSLGTTVNLSDFIDVSYLGERQQETPSPATPHVEQSLRGTQDSAQDDHRVTLAMDFEFDLPATPTHEPFPALPDVPNQATLQDTPHYALPTIATRRKSLPVTTYRTPVKNGARPQTAGGASMPRIVNPFINIWPAKNQSESMASPPSRRPSTAHGSRSASRSRTPFASTHSIGRSRQSKSRTSGYTTSGNAHDNALTGSPSPAKSEAVLAIRNSPSKTPRTSLAQTPMERFPGLPPRETYEELARSPAASFTDDPSSGTPKNERSKKTSEPTERFPGLPLAQTYEEPAHETAEEPVSEESFADDIVSTPQPVVKERYPGLPHRRTYEEHARTAMPPTRFRTPTSQQVKRPATARKPTSLRKMALKAAGSHTPVKTPLKAAAMTPGQVPCTPHPGVPLKGVCAYVEVFLSDGSCATTTYVSVLQALGAKTTKTFNTDRVTHVVYKEGSPTTLQRIRHHNKQVEETGVGSTIHCVNGRWVNDCKDFGSHVDETDEAYVVELDDMPALKRRRKSMEPMSLINIGGNVVRDRKSSSSLGRNAMMKLASSPAETGPSTPPMGSAPANKENTGDDSLVGEDSPSTPTYLAAPESLVQQTAPAHRVRKLDLQPGEVKNRRLTFWNGGA